MKKIFFLLLFFILLSGIVRSQTTITDSIITGGMTRYYNLYIPKNHITGSSRPLVFHLHGYGSNGVIEQIYTNYMPVADTADFLVAYPEGLIDSTGHQYWNVGFPGFQNAHNDVDFISNLIDALHAKYNIDLSKVYASGLSMGGYLCYNLAWKLSDKISAIASVSGSMYPAVFAACKPEGIVPIMEIHGTADNVVPYTSSNISTDIDSLLRFWVLADHCFPISDPVMLPNIDTTDGSTVMHFGWSAELANTTCELYRIVGGEHVDWPGAGKGNNMDFSASPTIWQFFNRYQQITSAVKEKETGSSSFSFFPNPSSNIIHLINNSNGVTTILDMTGRKILTSKEKDVDVSLLASGIYFIKYENSMITKIEKLVKF